MIFKSKTNPQNNYFNGKRIGVLGLAPRCGTTHIAIAISNYLSETEKKRVSLIEQNRHNDIICLAYLFRGICNSVKHPLYKHHVRPHNIPHSHS